MITPSMITAVKVRFIKEICENDFPEKGMTAWLTDIVWESGFYHYTLYFDFAEFEQVNDKYFKRLYSSNRFTKELETKTNLIKFTAKEAGFYDNKYSVSFQVDDSGERNDIAFKDMISEYLMCV